MQEWVKLEKKKDWKMESAFKLEMEGPYLQSNRSFPPPQRQAFLLVEAKFCLGVYHLLDASDMNSKKFIERKNRPFCSLCDVGCDTHSYEVMHISWELGIWVEGGWEIKEGTEF